MIGIIVSGHAQFASGLTSSLKLIMGEELHHYQVIDFVGTDTKELEVQMSQAIEAFKAYDGILICTDIVGGSPFKTAVLSSVGRKDIKVISGTNLPMLLDLMMVSETSSDIVSFAQHAMDVAKEMVLIFEEQVIESCDSDDGI